MKLIYIFTAILAFSLAEKNDEKIDDLEAMETLELKKEFSDLTPAASEYNNAPSQYLTSRRFDPSQPLNYFPTAPVNPSYVPSVPITARPPYSPPVQSDYVYPWNNWNNQYPIPTTTPVTVIKNEQKTWDNGAYRYEYQLSDGTHVFEEGYHTDPRNTDESHVKKGFYSYRGADGKTYTVSYWADHTGFHPSGDHLPTPPPVSAEIQAALDKQEAEKNKQPITYPTPTQKPSYYPPQHIHYPPQQTYYPPQQTYYPQQSGVLDKDKNKNKQPVTYPSPMKKPPHYPSQQIHYPDSFYNPLIILSNQGTANN